MKPTTAQMMQWVISGTSLFQMALDAVPDDDLPTATDLPGWTRAHVVAHVSSNADALMNLVHWARTGEPTPMYSSAEQRAHDIETGAALEAEQLRVWNATSAARLTRALLELTEAQWKAAVTTAQGREVTAHEIPWLRCRELFVHAIDLNSTVSWSDVPADFIYRLLDEAASRRSSLKQLDAINLRATDAAWHWPSEPFIQAPVASRPLATLAAWLTGRTTDLHTRNNPDLPELPAWL